MGRKVHVGDVSIVRMFCLLAAVGASYASEGDRSLSFRSCLSLCATSACVGDHCIPGCSLSSSAETAESRQVASPWVLTWTNWDCDSECRFRCMEAEEDRRGREGEGESPVKYYGKWPFRRIWGMQEPASVLFSALNFLSTLFGLLKFVRLVFWKLPRKPMGDKGPLYDYAGLWVVYGAMALNSWFWSAVFHARDTPFTEAWDYSSAIALIGGVLILSLFRTLNLRLEAPRVMYSAPIIAFTATHILYLNFYTFDYGLNMKVCLTMGTIQLLLWVFWAFFTKHPARVKLWIAVIGTSLGMLLEIYDFPPIFKILDAHSLWHFVTIPFIFLWWSFVCDDATFCTEKALKKGLETKVAKKED